jgi:glycosyltransferase involved in cell wall biosynthesis
MTRVLFIVNHDIVIYNFRLELVERLLLENYEVVIASPYGKRIDALIDLGCIYIKTEIDRHGMNLLSELKLIHEYHSLIKRISPDIVLTYTIKPNIYGGIACSNMKIPYISNITGLGTSIENNCIIRNIILKLYYYGIKNSCCIFFQNRTNMSVFANYKKIMSKCQLIPGSGVNLEKFKYIPYPAKDLTIRFLFMSRIMRDKGIIELLLAAEQIKIDFPDIKFDIIGMIDEDLHKQINAAIKKGIIEYHGYILDTRQYISLCSAVVLPSYHEGMANVLLESSASGRPVIASRIPGCIEAFDDRISGISVNVRDSDDLYNKMIEFIKMPYDDKVSMGIKAREKMEAEFSRKIIVDAYMKEISKALKVGRRS